MNALFLGKEIYLYLTGYTYKNVFILIGIISISIFIVGGLFGLIVICSKPNITALKAKSYIKKM